MVAQTLFTYNYEDLQTLTGMELKALYQHKTRGNFDPENLESVLIWLARHAREDVRQRMVAYAISRELPEKPGRAKRPRKPPVR